MKFHWKPKLGLQSVVWDEAVKINGADPDFHRRDLWDAIQSGNYPEWELRLQLFDQKFADKFDFDILDPTKIIPEELLEPVPVGRLVLDRMPDNFFAETEQVAFMTMNVPPGIDFSNDPVVAGAEFFVSRHAVETSRKCQFHAFADQRAEMSVPPFPAGRTHGDAQSGWACQLPAEFLG